MIQSTPFVRDVTMKRYLIVGIALLLPCFIIGCGKDKSDTYNTYITQVYEADTGERTHEPDPSVKATLTVDGKTIALTALIGGYSYRQILVNSIDGSIMQRRTAIRFYGSAENDEFTIDLSVLGDSESVYTNSVIENICAISITRSNVDLSERLDSSGKQETITITSYGNVNGYVSASFSGTLFSSLTGGLVDVSGSVTVKRKSDVYDNTSYAYLEPDPNVKATLIVDGENIALAASSNSYSYRYIYVNSIDGSIERKRTSIVFYGSSENENYTIGLEVIGDCEGVYTNSILEDSSDISITRSAVDLSERLGNSGYHETITITSYGNVDGYISANFSGTLFSNLTGGLVDVSGSVTVKRRSDVYYNSVRVNEENEKYIPSLVLDGHAVNFTSMFYSAPSCYLSKTNSYNSSSQSVVTTYRTYCGVGCVADNYTYAIGVTFYGNGAGTYSYDDYECYFSINILNFDGSSYDQLNYYSAGPQTVVVDRYGAVGDDVTLHFYGKTLSRRTGAFIDVSGEMTLKREPDNY